MIIQTTMQGMAKNIKVWQKTTPANASHIVNTMALESDSKRRVNLLKTMKFRNNNSKNFIMGKTVKQGSTPKGSILYLHLAIPNKYKEISQIKAIIGSTSKSKFLRGYDEGLTIPANELTYEFTKAARGGNKRNMPIAKARLVKGRRLERIRRGSLSLHKSEVKRFSASGNSFYADASNYSGRKKQAGIYFIHNHKWILLRPMERKDRKLPRTAWYSKAISSTIASHGVKGKINKIWHKMYTKKVK